MSCKSKKPRKVRQKKRRKKLGVAVVLLANVFFLGWEMAEFGGGKCPNLGVGNVRILGVVNVRLANNLTPEDDVWLCASGWLLVVVATSVLLQGVVVVEVEDGGGSSR